MTFKLGSFERRTDKREEEKMKEKLYSKLV